jgi:hypothetical protein
MSQRRHGKCDPQNSWCWAFLILLASVGSLQAHSLKTATGHSVNHQDAASITSCAQTRCPITDASFESQYGIRSADRDYPKDFQSSTKKRTDELR